MDSIKTLVVDDELPARRKIISFLKEREENYEIYDASNGIEAVEKIKSIDLDLVLLDIQMPGMNGFEVIEHIGVGKMPNVIFITAFDQYALDAFDVNAIDYLLKPFDQNRFHRALDRFFEKTALKNTRKNEYERLLNEINRTRNYTERFLVNHASKYFFVPVDEIIYVSSEEKYVSLHTKSGIHLLRDTMNSMEEKLSHENFIRVHRCFIVNISQIQEMQPWTHGDYIILLKNGEKISMSRRYRKDFFEKNQLRI
jgi:two-component system, LytTR family, response regulator